MQFKKNIIILTIIFLNIAITCYSKENKILIKVNNEIITTVDILNEIKFLSLINLEFQKISQEQQIKIAKNSLIKEKIKLIELLKFKKNLKLNDDAFEKLVENYFQNQEIKNMEDFKIFIKNKDLNIKFVREKISIDTFWKSLIYEKFNKNVKINENEIKKSVLEKDKQNEYLLSELVFSLDDNETLVQKLEKIKEIINQKSFAEAALNYSISDSSSNGGKLGWIKESVLNKKIRDELNITDIGKFTKPIVIPGGFLMLKKEKTREIKKSLNIDNEIKNIINKKTNDQLNRLSNIFIKKLRKNIQINEI